MSKFLVKAEAWTTACGLWAASYSGPTHQVFTCFLISTISTHLFLGPKKFIHAPQLFSQRKHLVPPWQHPDGWRHCNPAGEPSFHMWKTLQDPWKSMWELLLPSLCAERMQTLGVSAIGWCSQGRLPWERNLWEKERAGNQKKERAAGQRSCLCKRHEKIGHQRVLQGVHTSVQVCACILCALCVFFNYCRLVWIIYRAAALCTCR